MRVLLGAADMKVALAVSAAALVALVVAACGGDTDCGASTCGACQTGYTNVDVCRDGEWQCTCEPIAGAGTVRCGANECSGGDVCCSSTATSTCAPACSGVDVLRCDGPEDCAGNVCCSRIQASGLSEAACRARSDCPAGNGLALCHADGDCTNPPAPGATKCCPLGPAAPGVGVCDFPTGDFCTP